MDFHSKFKKYKYELEKWYVDKTTGVFIFKFDSIMLAQGALLLATRKGWYKTGVSKSQNASAQNMLSSEQGPQHSLQPRRLVRPSPNRVCRFKVLSKELTVRSRRTLDGASVIAATGNKIIETKYQNEEVYVNRIRGRRARLVDNPNGKLKLGWVSLFSKGGLPYLEQLE